MTELETLIRQQQRDDTHRIHWEPFVAMSLDSVNGLDPRYIKLHRRDCPLHGLREWVTYSGGSQGCRRCDRERKRRKPTFEQRRKQAERSRLWRERVNGRATTTP